MDALGEATSAADVSTDTMAAAALPADVEMEPRRGTTRPGDDEHVDSTAGTNSRSILG